MGCPPRRDCDDCCDVRPAPRWRFPEYWQRRRWLLPDCYWPSYYCPGTRPAFPSRRTAPGPFAWPEFWRLFSAFGSWFITHEPKIQVWIKLLIILHMLLHKTIIIFFPPIFLGSQNSQWSQSKMTKHSCDEFLIPPAIDYSQNIILDYILINNNNCRNFFLINNRERERDGTRAHALASTCDLCRFRILCSAKFYNNKYTRKKKDRVFIKVFAATCAARCTYTYNAGFEIRISLPSSSFASKIPSPNRIIMEKKNGEENVYSFFYTPPRAVPRCACIVCVI